MVSVELTSEERELLRSGLLEWGGPARPTAELARAIGFVDLDDLWAQCQRLRELLAENQPLSRADWRRTLLATEIVFASDVLGSGVDWSSTSGLADDDTIRLLRAVQRKLAHAVHTSN